MRRSRRVPELTGHRLVGNRRGTPTDQAERAPAAPAGAAQTQRVAYTTLTDNGRTLYAVAAWQWLQTKIILDKSSSEQALITTARPGGPDPTPPAWQQKLKSACLIEDPFARYNWLSLWQIWRFYDGSIKVVQDHLPYGTNPTSVRDFNEHAADPVGAFRYAFQDPNRQATSEATRPGPRRWSPSPMPTAILPRTRPSGDTRFGSRRCRPVLWLDLDPVRGFGLAFGRRFGLGAGFAFTAGRAHCAAGVPLSAVGGHAVHGLVRAGLQGVQAARSFCWRTGRACSRSYGLASGPVRQALICSSMRGYSDCLTAAVHRVSRWLVPLVQSWAWRICSVADRSVSPRSRMALTTDSGDAWW